MEKSNIKTKTNRSTTYIIPILSYFIPFNKTLLINSYLYDVNQPELNIPNINGIFIKFRKSDNEIHKVIENRLRSHNSVIKLYNLDEMHFMVFIKFGLEIAKEIKLILDGKYSKLNDSTKNIILKYWIPHNTTKLNNILYKREVYKKYLEEELDIKIPNNIELGSMLNLHDETYNNIIKLKESKLSEN